MKIIQGGLDDSRVQTLLAHHFVSARAETAPGSAHALDLSGLKSPDVSFWSVWDGECVMGVVRMRIGKPLAIIIGVLTVWPLFYMLLFIGVFVIVAFTIFQQAQQHQPGPGPGFLPYIFIPHILTMLLMFVLMAFYIIHVFKNRALKDDRRVLWAVVLFMGLPLSAPIYWWFYVWPRASSNVSV